MSNATKTTMAEVGPSWGSLRGFILAFSVLVCGVASSQVSPIQVRFEPGCDEVRAFLGSTLSNVVSYNWDLGDGTTSTLAAPVHEYPFGTPITVRLTTIDGNGESATFAQQYTTQDQLDFGLIELPNVFTPNGDGHNDEFAPITERLLGPCAQLAVYNRHGQLLFESLGNDISWDGRTLSGQPASDGVYFYVFTLGDSKLNSTVTLVR
jgi:gliding motility-associated-like protein